MALLRILVPAVTTVVVSAAGESSAQVKNQGWDGGYSDKASVRSDVAFGASSGVRFGDARGWLNKASELGHSELEANTKAAFGNGGTFWIGGALKDYFVFALGTTGGSLSGNGLSGSGFAYFVRLETFPFVSFARPVRDLGVATTFGAGSYSLQDRDRKVAEGGAMSLIGIAVFHESLRWGNFALGPSLEYDRWFSQSMTVDTAGLALRVAFTTGP